MPRKGHLEAMLHTMGYLNLRHNFRLVLDPSNLDIDQSNFQQCDWKVFYECTVEPIPTNAPTSRFKEVDLYVFVNSVHASKKQSRRSRTRFMMYMDITNSLVSNEAVYHKDISFCCH